MKYLRHLRVITKHKIYVMRACFKVGLLLQGALHDLSKYGITEFKSSAKFFQGNSSPIDAEKVKNGYSIAWQNHKGKNKHHWQYWVDWENGVEYAVEMPLKYLAEMICDWVGAGKAYNKGNWTIETLKTWYANNRPKMILHPQTATFLDYTIETVAKDEKELYWWIGNKRIELHYLMVKHQFSAY